MNVNDFMLVGEIHSTESYILLYIYIYIYLYNQMVLACLRVLLDIIENPRFEAWYRVTPKKNGDIEKPSKN